jgi:hypothetical protein
MADMHLVLGEANGNASMAKCQYRAIFLTQRIPNRRMFLRVDRSCFCHKIMIVVGR